MAETRHALMASGARPAPVRAAALGGLAAVLACSAHAQTLPPPPASPRPVVEHLYDAVGNLTDVVLAPGSGLGVNGAGLATVMGYDPLHRRQTLLDARGKLTVLGYLAADQLNSVRDPRQLLTSYAPDAFGQSGQLSSPDTGTATMTYDAAGNLLTRLDSRGVLATYTHDGLNRLRSVVYTKSGEPAQGHSWVFDQQGAGFSFGVGRLTSTQYPGGASTYVYDALGRITGSTQTVTGATGAVSHTTGYAYDAAGRVTQVVYPSGRVLYINRSGGTPMSLAVAPDANAPPVLLVSNLQFEPLPGGTGQARSWVWHLSSGTMPNERVFDTSGRMVRYPLGGALRDLTYDAADRITSYTHLNAINGNAVASLDQGFGYDELGRLTSVSSGVGSWIIGYDDNGNRTSVTHTPIGGPAGTRGYTTAPDSNRLVGMTNPTRTFLHDAAGNTEKDRQGALSFTAIHDLAGRISELSSTMPGGYAYDTSYTHNNDGLRVLKRVVLARRCTGVAPFQSCVNLPLPTPVVFVYDQSGQLLGEYDGGSGAVLREYVWLQGMPVAVLDGAPSSGATYYIQADHLNTPRVVIDRYGQQRWSWVAEPFGNSSPVENPVGVGSFQLNLRMPGQYWDAESGLAYNWHRTYDASLGRYTQSDPIGLAGGINTYAYVGGDPVSVIDPYGLFGWADMPTVPQGVVDFSAGMGDVLLLGQGQRLRDLFGVDGGINPCSTEYGAGEWVGVAGSVAAGGLGGLRAAGAAGSRGPHTTFSHFVSRNATNSRSGRYIPAMDNSVGRWATRGNNRINGNYVTPQRHYRHDQSYYGHWRGANYRNWGDRLPGPLQTLDRVPNTWWGTGAGAAYGTAGAALAGSECTCR
jgi:RHS repeat-associated protein